MESLSLFFFFSVFVFSTSGRVQRITRCTAYVYRLHGANFPPHFFFHVSFAFLFFFFLSLFVYVLPCTIIIIVSAC